MGLTHSGSREQLQGSLCRYEFLNGVVLLPSGFLHRLHCWVAQGTGAHSLGLHQKMLPGCFGRFGLLASNSKEDGCGTR